MEQKELDTSIKTTARNNLGRSVTLTIFTVVRDEHPLVWARCEWGGMQTCQLPSALAIASWIRLENVGVTRCMHSMTTYDFSLFSSFTHTHTHTHTYTHTHTHTHIHTHPHPHPHPHIHSYINKHSLAYTHLFITQKHSNKDKNHSKRPFPIFLCRPIWPIETIEKEMIPYVRINKNK